MVVSRAEGKEARVMQTPTAQVGLIRPPAVRRKRRASAPPEEHTMLICEALDIVE